MLEAEPSLAVRARAWAKDPSFWVRRVALLVQLAPLRRGNGDFSLFIELATPLLGEREFFVQKAIGWVLREVSKKRPEVIRRFLVQNGVRCSAVTWREAVKYLPGAAKRDVEARRESARGASKSASVISDGARRRSSRRGGPAPVAR